MRGLRPSSRCTVRRAFLRAGSLIVVGALAACAAPGASQNSSGSSSTAPAAVATTLPSTPVTLDFYLESNFTAAFDALQKEFTKQYPSVTFKNRSDAFQNLAQNAMKIISSPDAPDLFRYPTVATAAKAGLLANLDPYAKAYGWDSWPQGTLNQVRVNEYSSRGSGSLYALGVGYNTTGVYYNKALAQKLGITVPPATLDDLEAAMAKAKAAGVLPIMTWNKSFGAAFAVQALQNQYEGLDKLKAWIYGTADSTYDTPSAVAAAQKVQEWGKAGYFPADANAIDYAPSVGRFSRGEGLFMFNGDWEAGTIQKNAPGRIGFFLVPGVKADAKHVAMAAPATYVVPANAKHKDAVAFFLNWVHTNATARQIVLDVTGSSPGGPADLPAPTAPSGSLIAETLAAAGRLATDDGAIDFVANATPGMLTTGIGPNVQLLITGRMTPKAYVAAVQAQWAKENGQ